MSTNGTFMTLGEYIRALIEALRDCDPESYQRMCQVVGSLKARIQLDEEAVVIWMNLGVLQIKTAAGDADAVDGEGRTTRATVLALLTGSLEVSEAVLNESLAVYGGLEQVNRMFHAIELLLDAAPRCPRLQKLSRDFVSRSDASPSNKASGVSRANWYPFAVLPEERELLALYDLLP